MRYYITMWCSEGVECVQDITEFRDWDTDNAFAVLSGETPNANPLNSQVSAMRLRARFNAQRNYEIYVFTSDNDINEGCVKQWSESDPQSFADWVRKNHTVCLYKDRAPQRVAIV
jgi:hypothetical protein